MERKGNNKIAIYGSRSQDAYLHQLAALFLFLDREGFRVVIHEKFMSYLDSHGIDMGHATPVEKLPSDTSLVLSIGGDGTFLRTARWIGEMHVPILGVNTGHLGFLSSCGINDVEDMIGEVCRGQIEVERRMLLHIESDSLPRNCWPYALNEVTVTRDDLSSIISVNTKVNGCFLADYRADGLIVATPTGSTAYSLSAGGPILQPTIDCIALSPIAPHTLTLRPLVVGADSVMDLKVESRSKNFRLSIDDRTCVLPSGTILKIKRAPFTVLLIRRKDSNFATILRDKLLWSAGITS